MVKHINEQCRVKGIIVKRDSSAIELTRRDQAVRRNIYVDALDLNPGPFLHQNAGDLFPARSHIKDCALGQQGRKDSRQPGST